VFILQAAFQSARRRLRRFSFTSSETVVATSYHRKAKDQVLYLSVPHRISLVSARTYVLRHGVVFRRDTWPRIWSGKAVLLDLYGDYP
jgi:hypothetical protein